MHYIQRAVRELVDEYSTQDPFTLAKEMGIQVFYYPFRKVKGMVIEIGAHKMVGLNSELPERLQRVVLAHELGHYTLSPAGVGYFFTSEHTLMESKVEYEANRFAVELLAGDADPEEGETLEQFAARMGVPWEMIRLIK
ncbi:ImmA/IrrE family metallo-endopeptidase [Paradesulfitobacterium aromaticivorans]